MEFDVWIRNIMLNLLKSLVFKKFLNVDYRTISNP